MDGALFPQPRRHLQSPGGGAGLLQAPRGAQPDPLGARLVVFNLEARSGGETKR